MSMSSLRLLALLLNGARGHVQIAHAILRQPRRKSCQFKLRVSPISSVAVCLTGSAFQSEIKVDDGLDGDQRPR